MGLAQNALTTVGPPLVDLGLTLPASTLIATWAPVGAFATNAYAVPRRPNGFYYQATTGGTTGNVPPAWPLVAGATVTDGTVVWTCQGVSVQSRIEQSINIVSEAIERYCSRKFLYGQWTENLGAAGRNKLCVSRPPLRSITSISFQGGVLPTTGDYEIYEQQVDGNGVNVPSESGIIYRQAGWTNTAPFVLAAQPYQRPGDEFDLYQVVYVGGYQTPQFDGQPGVGGALVAPAIPADLPFEIEKACIDAVVSLWRRNGWDRNVASESFADANVEYREDADLLPPEVKSALNRYRRPV